VAHSLSAKKRVRQNEKRRARNRARKTEIRDQVKLFQADLTKGDLGKAATDLRSVVQTLDRNASRGTIHKNTAARKRSRLQLRLNAALKAGPVKAAPTKAGKAGKGTAAAKA
jgi:small subunit ribosomal protein S20